MKPLLVSLFIVIIDSIFFELFNDQNYGCVINLFYVGRSMGSRAAACIVKQCKDTADEAFVQGLICLSFPLHPAKQHSKLRSEDLLHVRHPILLVSGSADEMCDKVNQTISLTNRCSE